MYVSIYDINSLINQKIKTRIKKKNQLKSLLMCIVFNVTSKKFYADNTSGSKCMSTSQRPVEGRSTCASSPFC